MKRLPNTTPEKTAAIDLGLALLRRRAVPGVRYSRGEMAAWCGCSTAAIAKVERNALRKIRNRLFFGPDKALGDLLKSIFYVR